ncbi:threonine/serine exporter family protein [Arcticibacter tournemirensis]|uniref:Threonine/serine exporter n=1 Tax=Arcticibacter tournemirensis TaxID=699437 RepID=A0A4Q0ME70_9SPHI|nr:threonine/serine exporter family protein [Arcticibacter tournemirensis]KAA8485449.1 threonine/serine exporter family protein [Arcticibacter tournemirensis]RXF71720.1 threonine/serine exporter [Arcticibacter tournemirensis]
MTPESIKNTEIKELGATLLHIGALLLSAGASTGRTRNTITRISDSFGYNTEFVINNRTLLLTLSDENNEYFFNSLKRSSPHGVNFTLLSGISHLSWEIVEDKLTINQINEQLAKLTALPHYERWIVLILVGLAGSSFCRVNGGEALDMLAVFIATFAGLFVRQEATRLRFNLYMCIYFGAFTASLIAGGAVKFGMGYTHEQAFATSVLFLIPGVPLINTFSDMIEGNLQNAIVRGMNGLIISFAIGLGLLTSMFIYQF